MKISLKLIISIFILISMISIINLKNIRSRKTGKPSLLESLQDLISACTKDTRNPDLCDYINNLGGQKEYQRTRDTLAAEKRANPPKRKTNQGLK